jgi:uncharacterized protein YerC
MKLPNNKLQHIINSIDEYANSTELYKLLRKRFHVSSLSELADAHEIAIYDILRKFGMAEF